MLRLEELGHRVLPSVTTLAEILPHYDAALYQRPMPDVPADQILVAGADLDPSDVTSEIYDVFAAHGAGNAARIVIHDTRTGENVADFFAYEESFRGGVESITVIGPTLYVSAGPTGGARIVAIDLRDQSITSFLAPGFGEDWRGGLQLSVADIDHVNGTESPLGAEELLILGASPGGAPIVSFANPDGSQAKRPFFMDDPADREKVYEFAPAMVGVQLDYRDGAPVMGFCVQVKGALPDAEGKRHDTKSFTFDGELVPDAGSYLGVFVG